MEHACTDLDHRAWYQRRNQLQQPIASWNEIRRESSKTNIDVRAMRVYVTVNLRLLGQLRKSTHSLPILLRLHLRRHRLKICRPLQNTLALTIILVLLHPRLQRLNPIRMNLIQKRKISLLRMALSPIPPPRREILNESLGRLILRTLLWTCCKIGHGAREWLACLDEFGDLHELVDTLLSAHFGEGTCDVCEADFVCCDFQ